MPEVRRDFWSDPGQKAVAAALGVTLLAVALFFWLRPADPEEVRLKEEFSASVRPACEDYVTQVNAALGRLETSMREGFAGVAEEFAEICVNSDGLIERSKGEEEAKRVLTDALRASVTMLVTRSLEEFHASASEAHELLEARLLLSAPANGKLAKVLKANSLQVQNYIPQPPVAELRGSGLGKALEEGFSWVPIGGDLWEISKLALGDPRENGIRERARNFVHGEKARWLAMVVELKTVTPDVSAAEKNCRSAFKPKQALARLAAE